MKEYKAKPLSKIAWKSVCVGVMMHSFVMMMIQDFYGLDDYIQMCKDHWIVIDWWLWLGPMILVAMLFQRILAEEKNQWYRANQNSLLEEVK